MAMETGKKRGNRRLGDFCGVDPIEMRWMKSGDRRAADRGNRGLALEDEFQDERALQIVGLLRPSPGGVPFLKKIVNRAEFERLLASVKRYACQEIGRMTQRKLMKSKAQLPGCVVFSAQRIEQRQRDLFLIPINGHSKCRNQ